MLVFAADYTMESSFSDLIRRSKYVITGQTAKYGELTRTVSLEVMIAYNNLVKLQNKTKNMVINEVYTIKK